MSAQQGSPGGGLLLVGAHPDDEIAAAGTIALYTRHGFRTTVVLMTRGGLGHMTMSSDELKRVRTREAEKSAATLGAELMFLDYEDGAIPQSREVALQLVDVFRSKRPSVVITQREDDKHPDHRNTHRNVLDAFYLASLPLVKTAYPYFCVKQIYVFSHDAGQVYIDISEVIDLKIEAAMCHESQFAGWLLEHRGGVDRLGVTDYREALRARAAAAGWRCRVRYAEAYEPVFPARPTALTKFPETE